MITDNLLAIYGWVYLRGTSHTLGMAYEVTRPDPSNGVKKKMEMESVRPRPSWPPVGGGPGSNEALAA